MLLTQLLYWVHSSFILRCELPASSVWSVIEAHNYRLFSTSPSPVRSQIFSIYLFLQLLVSRGTAQNNSHYLTCMKSLFLYLIICLVLFGLKLLTLWSLIVLLLYCLKRTFTVYDIHSTIICHIYKLLIYIVVFIYENCYQHTRNLLKSDKLIKHNFFSMFRHQAWYLPIHIFLFLVAWWFNNIQCTNGHLQGKLP